MSGRSSESDNCSSVSDTTGPAGFGHRAMERHWRANTAPAVLLAVTSLLDQLSLAYTLRIETTGDKVFHHSHPASVEPIVHPIGTGHVERTVV